IGAIGGAFMLHPDTGARGQEIDLDFFGYYALGRGGVLGDVSGDVVAAAFHFFSPDLVTGIWEGSKTKVSPSDAAAHYAESCAMWGRARLDDVGDLDTFNKLGERVVEAGDPRGLPLFAGWRAMPLPEDAPARAYHLIHVLREQRGGANGIAVRALGLTAPEAVSVNTPNMFQLFGWTGDMPDAEVLRPKLEEAEEITDTICSQAFAVLDEGEQETFAKTIDAIATKLGV
ncbi:MAG: hypothetical protein WD826_02890, partial [Actinomycetota bacterium]